MARRIGGAGSSCKVESIHAAALITLVTFLLLFDCCNVIIIIQVSSLSLLPFSSSPASSSSTTTTTNTLVRTRKLVAGIPVHPVPLSATAPVPFAYAVSSAANLPSERRVNFLATQVWPSARFAAHAMRWSNDSDNDNNDTNNTSSQEEDTRTAEAKATAAAAAAATADDWSDLTVCELGCGPGLPSLTAALVMNAKHVYATDTDILALELVQAAADDQGLSKDRFETLRVDLLNPYILVQQQQQQDNPYSSEKDQRSSSSSLSLLPSSESLRLSSLPHADLYILSDVFESAAVATGAARLCHQILFRPPQQGEEEPRRLPHVWVFAQPDRAQREVFVQHLEELFHDNDKACVAEHDEKPDKNDPAWIAASAAAPPFEAPPSMSFRWKSPSPSPSSWQESPRSTFNTRDRLWLCNVDETKVRYQ